MRGIEDLKKTYETSKDHESLDVVTKQVHNYAEDHAVWCLLIVPLFQLADNKEKIADLESQKEKLTAAVKKLGSMK
jgi:hypothetical protein